MGSFRIARAVADSGERVRAALDKTSTSADKISRCAKTRAPQVDAFGCTFVLAPCFSLRMDREDSVLVSAFATSPGLAILLSSEIQPTARSSALLQAESALLCADAQRLLANDNAGGASRISEALSVEVLHRAFGARLRQLEMEIRYWPPSGTSITDFSVELCDGVCVGVSVTRALGPPGVPFGMEAAAQLLRKKLKGVLSSTDAACGEWDKQILHVWARSASDADAIERAYALLDPALLADTVVLVTVCEAEALKILFEEKATTAANASGAGTRRVREPKGAKDEEHLRILRESDPIQCRSLLCERSMG